MLPLIVALASYDLQVELFPEEKVVIGKGTVTWVNSTAAPVEELWWHLYLNAFRDEDSTFMVESGGKLRKAEFVDGEYGNIEVSKLELQGADLLAKMSYEHPDDNNDKDRTVMRTPLPRGVGPGETITLQVEFRSKLPRVFARSGWAPPSFMMVAQWFPKLGVLENTGWNCHQYHGSGEFYSDYGHYRVAITVPADIEVGATGKMVSSSIAGAKKTLIFEQANVHDFAFAADHRFVRVEKKFIARDEVSPVETHEAAQLLGAPVSELELPDVSVTLLLQPDHVEYADRYYRAVANGLKWFGLWYGAYPYETVTVIDGPRTAAGAMGMEYPTLFTAGVRWPAPEKMPSPEFVTIHEFGHQYWYGLNGTNEFESPWLDEGFNSYSTGKVLDRAYGQFSYAPSLFRVPLMPWFSNVKLWTHELAWLGAAPYATNDEITRNSWEFRHGASYSTNAYTRPELALHQLEADIGTSTMARVMRAYHQKFRFRHPRAEDFVNVVEEVSGRSISLWMNETIRSSRGLDYAIAAIENKERAVTVTVERRGEAVHPISVKITFEDDNTELLYWDGVYRYQRFRFPPERKVRSAEIVTPLYFDLDRTNDTRSTETSPTPALSIGLTTQYFVQTFLALLGGLF
jgi:hypothetical protein